MTRFVYKRGRSCDLRPTLPVRSNFQRGPMSKPMGKLLTILLILLIVVGLLLLISWLVPDVNKIAKDLSQSGDLPYWIAGLAAPIVYLYRKLTGSIGKWFESGATKKVEAIEASRADVRKEVDELLQWRRDTLRQEIQSMQAVRLEMDSLRTRLSVVQSEMEVVRSRPLAEDAAKITQKEIDTPLGGGKEF